MSISEEQMEELFEFLQGKTIPEGFTISHKPKVGYKTAFAIIYYLQERLRILPDTFEMCQGCGLLYDSDCEGISLNEDDMETGEGKPLSARHCGQWHRECVPISWRWKE